MQDQHVRAAVEGTDACEVRTLPCVCCVCLCVCMSLSLCAYMCAYVCVCAYVVIGDWVTTKPPQCGI